MEFTLANSYILNPVPTEKDFVPGPVNYQLTGAMNFRTGFTPEPLTGNAILASFNLVNESPFTEWPIEIWGLTENGSYSIETILTEWNFAGEGQEGNQPPWSMTTIMLPNDIMRMVVTSAPFNIPHSSSFFPRGGFLTIDCALDNTHNIVDYTFYPNADEEVILPEFSNGVASNSILSNADGSEFLAIMAFPPNESGDSSQIIFVGSRYDMASCVYSQIACVNGDGSTLNTLYIPLVWDGNNKIICYYNPDTTSSPGEIEASLEVLTFTDSALPSGEAPYPTSGTFEAITFDDSELNAALETAFIYPMGIRDFVVSGTKLGLWLFPPGEEPTPDTLIPFVLMDIATATYDKYVMPFSAIDNYSPFANGVNETLYAYAIDFMEGVPPYMIREVE